MATSELQKKLAEWRQRCAEVSNLTDVPQTVADESPADRQKRIRFLLAHYDKFCEYYFPHFLTLRDKVTGEVLRTVHNAPFHNAAAKKVKETPNLKAVFKWPRGHAKSTHFDIFIPLWLKFQYNRLINVMVVVGKSEESAQTLLGDIQAELEYNQRIIADFGPQKGTGAWLEKPFLTLEKP